MKKRTLRTVLMVLLLVFIALAFFSISPDPEPMSLATATPTPSATPVVETPNITYTSKGFVPATVSVKVGQLLRFNNGTNSTIQIESNPHPAHTDDTDLNLGSMSAGASITITATKTGTFGVHNEFNPALAGTVTIQ